MRREVIDYLPDFMKSIREIYEIARVCDIFIEGIYDAVIDSVYDRFIDFASEERIEKWEKLMGIMPADSLDKRRNHIKSIMRGKRKLNEETIKSIVKAVSGGVIYVDFFDSSVYVRVKDAENQEAFSEAEKVILSFLPAHLGADVREFNNNWNEVKNNFSSWADIYALSDWSEICNLNI